MGSLKNSNKDIITLSNYAVNLSRYITERRIQYEKEQAALLMELDRIKQEVINNCQHTTGMVIRRCLLAGFIIDEENNIEYYKNLYKNNHGNTK